jgi:Cu(I)/Ag(I) efflux system membrane fusion protein
MNINRLMVHKKLIIITAVAGVTGFVIGQQSFFHQQTLSAHQSENLIGNLPNSPLLGEDIYVCPMHPEITADSPGDCPICGMNMVKHKHSHFLNNNDIELPTIRISPAVKHNLGIKTAKAKIGKLQRNIETLGKITRIDLTARRIITPPIPGVISYIIDKSSGDEINAGELLFSISTEQLLEQQRLFQELSASGDTSAASLIIPQLIKSGLSNKQISRLQSGEPANFSVEVYAKEAGYIFSRRGNKGDSIPSRFTVFNIGSNYQVVEVTAEIFERQWGWVKEGQQTIMTVRGLPGLTFSGKVVGVEPPVGYTTRSLEVRLKFKTDHPGLSQSMFAHISIIGQTRDNILMVPRDTVIRTGDEDRVVLIRDDGLFQPITVVAGEESNGMIEIISGLNKDDAVVSSGQFLIDSESNLQSALRRMTTRKSDHSGDDKGSL